MTIPTPNTKWLAGGTITVLIRTKDKSLIRESKNTEHSTIINHVRWMKHRKAMP